MIVPGAGLVVDDDLLAQFLRHAGAERAGDQVGAAAGRERHDQADRTFRIGGGCRGSHCERQDQSASPWIE